MKSNQMKSNQIKTNRIKFNEIGSNETEANQLWVFETQILGISGPSTQTVLGNKNFERFE